MLFACATVAGFAPEANAQRARFPDFFSLDGGQPQNLINQGQQVFQNAGQAIAPLVTQPPAILTPPAATFQGLPGLSAQQPFVTPNQFPQIQLPQVQSPQIQLPQPQLPQINNQSFPLFPRVQAPQAPLQQPLIQFPWQLPPQQPPLQPQVNLPQVNAPQIRPPNLPQFQPGPVGNFPQFNGIYNGSNWPYQTQGQNWWPSVNWAWPSQAWARLRTQVLPRVLERPRIRQTWLYGSSGDNATIGNELEIHDIELATTATIPQFLGGAQPLRISPGFIFHFWNGPDEAIVSKSLPAQAYSAYLAFDHITDPRRNSGIETNLTIGVYSDFDHIDSDSVRLTGNILGWQRVNSYTTAKLGIEYLDRVRVKLLPAVGVFMAPNPDLKIDLFFPRSKIAHRLPNFRNREGWGYVGGEYGGGSWTIERTQAGGPTIDDQVDINDVRAFIGVEWIGSRRVTGFFEFGYAFNRELVFRSDELNPIDIQDTLLLRSGLAF